MANEFIIKNGYFSKDNSKVSGSLDVGTYSGLNDRLTLRSLKNPTVLFDVNQSAFPGFITTNAANSTSTSPNSLVIQPGNNTGNGYGGDILIQGGNTGVGGNTGLDGGSIFIKTGTSEHPHGLYGNGSIIIDSMSPNTNEIDGNIQIKGGEIQIFSGSLVFQHKGVNWTDPDIKNIITTIPTSNQQATGSNPLYIKPGTNDGSDGIGAPLILEGGNTLGSQGGAGGNIEISAGTSSTTAYSNSVSGSIILKGREINNNSPIVYDIPGYTNTTTWFNWGPEGGGNAKYVKLGVVTSSYNQSAGQQGVMIYTETSTPGTTAAAWSFTENILSGQLAHSKVTAISGSFKYLTGRSPMKIESVDADTGNNTSLEIVSNNFTLSTSGDVTATSGILSMDKTIVSEVITTKVKSGTTGGDALEIESSNLSLDTAGKLSSTELSATTASLSLVRGNSKIRIDNGADDLEIVSANFNVTDTGEVSSGGSDGISTTSITASSDISASGTIQGNHLRSNSLTSGNVVIAGTNGRLEGTTDFTYNTSNKLLSSPTASFDHLIVSQVISSSIINTSGSNIFGDEATDTQTLNGSVIINNASNQASETTALMINGSNIVGTRELKANAFTDTTIGTTTNALTVSTGLDLNSGTTFNGSTAKTISVDVSDFMTNGSNNRIVTATGADAMNAEANLTFDGSTLGVNGLISVGGERAISSSTGYLDIGQSLANSDSRGIRFYSDENLAMTIDTNGDVGIGTTSPGEKLEVVGNISASGFIKSDNSLRIGDEGDNGFLFISGSDSNNDDRNSQIKFQRSLEFRSHGGSTDEILTLDYLGNVGIGKANAAEKLEVVGNISSSGNITGNSFIKGGGTSAQFLKADGSVDSSTYLTSVGTINLASGVTGTLPVGNGGTGLATLSAGNIPYGNGTNAFASNSALNFNESIKQLHLTGDSSNAPLKLTNVQTNEEETKIGLILNSSNNGVEKATLGDNAFNSTTIPTAVTNLSDVTSAGSGQIITTSERNAISSNTSGISTNTSNIANNSLSITNKAAKGANTDITSIINSSLTTIGSNNSENTENYINFAAGKIALTQGSNLVVHAGADLRPGTDNSMNLGTSAYMWADAYSKQFISAASTTSAPAFVIDKDSPTTGFYDKAENVIGVSVNGNQWGYFDNNGLQVDATGQSQFGGDVVISSHLQAHCLGIGTSPSTVSGEIRAAGDVTANYSSDKRLKKNIKPLSSALNKLLQISGVEFDWIEKEGVHSHKGHDVGVIAQEVEEVLPEVVVTRDNGYKAVNYEKIVPLLIEAIKDLKAEVDELKKSK